MDKPRFLSGYELVAKGLTKIETSLPEVGLKDVTPNGSWLEQKQLQSVLESRKQLIEVERIEKMGQLSQAEWRDDLKLAEVTKKVGPHWQFLGHNVGKHLYLRPEEALYLMECNCLLLKHNEVTISLQKAYSLVLGHTISLAQYKVYASLSRVGYRIIRHNEPVTNKNNKKDSIHSVKDSEMTDVCNDPNVKENDTEGNSNDIIKDKNNRKDSVNSVNDSEMSDVCNDPTVKRNDTEGNFNDNIKVKNKKKDGVNYVNDSKMSYFCNDPTVKENDSERISNDIIKEIKSIDDSDDIAMKSVDNSENMNKGNVPMENKNSLKKEIDETNCTNVKENLDGVERNIIVDNNANEKALSGAVSEVEDVMGEETESYSSNVVTKANFTIDEDGVIRFLNKTKEEIELELSRTLEQNSNKSNRRNTKTKFVRYPISSYQQKLQKLQTRKLKPLDQKVIEETFSSIPNIYRQKEVTINVPDEKLLPRNVFLNNTTYVLNVDQVRTKVNRSSSTPSNGNEPSPRVRRIGECFTNSAPQGDTPQIANNTFRQEFSRVQFSSYSNWRPRQEFPRVQFSPYSTWRPRLHSNFYYPFNNMFIPRPFSSLPGFFVNPRYRFQPAPFVNSINQPSVSTSNNACPNNANRHAVSNNRGPISLNKFQLQIKMSSFRTIQNLVERQKQLAPLTPNITDPLIKLIGHYNSKYNERLCLTNNFELINDVQPIEVIELDDEETNRSKRRRLNEEGDAFDRNINAIKGLACKLRELDLKKQCASRHRRALSNVIKKFNKSFNADIYLNKDYEIIDRRFVTLESSSESDSNKKNKRKRKLRNPFNILKRLKDKADTEARSSKDDVEMIETDNKTKETLLKHFDKNWIPNDDDFGRPEICTNNHSNSRIIDSREDELVYEFLKESRESYNSWTDLKTSFYENLEASTIALKSQQIDIMNRDFMMDFDARIKPILVPEDCTDMRTVLEKLRIISTNKDLPNETSLRIVFDVYNRNVQNFKKTNLPNPHFRIICLEESSVFPSAAEVGCLLAKYDDNIPLVFAVIGFGSSISYLQIKPIDLDIYIPNDLG